MFNYIKSNLEPFLVGLAVGLLIWATYNLVENVIVKIALILTNKN
jgi:hypothetical protein